MKKTVKIRDLLPLVEDSGYLTGEAKKILLKAVDALVRTFHATVLTAINKIKFNKYTNAVIKSVEERLKQESINRDPDNQLKHIIRQTNEAQKINDYIKEKLQMALSLKSGSIIMFQYINLNGSVSNRTGMVVGGSDGPNKVWFSSKSGEIFLKVIDLSKSTSGNSIYQLLKYLNNIEGDNSGRSTKMTFTDAVTNKDISSYISHNNFRSFNVSRISYLSTIKLNTLKGLAT
jgi:hypothetical protein